MTMFQRYSINLGSENKIRFNQISTLSTTLSFVVTLLKPIVKILFSSMEVELYFLRKNT